MPGVSGACTAAAALLASLLQLPVFVLGPAGGVAAYAASVVHVADDTADFGLPRSSPEPASVASTPPSPVRTPIRDFLRPTARLKTAFYVVNLRHLCSRGLEVDSYDVVLAGSTLVTDDRICLVI